MKFSFNSRSPCTSKHAARRKAAEQRGPHFRRVDAGLPRERKRFADRGQRAADHELIAGLADLTGTGLADMDDALGVAHRLEDGPHARQARSRRRRP